MTKRNSHRTPDYKERSVRLPLNQWAFLEACAAREFTTIPKLISRLIFSYEQQVAGVQQQPAEGKKAV